MAARVKGVKPQAATFIKLDDLVREYIAERKTAGVSKSFLSELRYILNRHVFPFLPVKPVDKLTYPDLMIVANRLQSQSQATRNRYIGYLKTIFRWGIRHGFTKDNPLSIWSKVKEGQRIPQLNISDLKKIIQHAEPHLKWAITVELNLGTRPGAKELLSLKWSDVDFDKGLIRVYGTKNKTWRTIPIGDDFRRQLLSQKAVTQTDNIIECKGRTIKTLRKSFATAMRKAGITYPCEMYLVRHLLGSVLLAGGADLAAVSALLGHKSITTTLRSYIHVMEGAKEKAIGLLPSIFTTNETMPERLIS
jgi:integrase